MKFVEFAHAISLKIVVYYKCMETMAHRERSGADV